MTSEVLTQPIGAGATATFGRGRIFNLLQAPGGAVSIVAENRRIDGHQTQIRKFNNIPAGSKYTAPPGEEWTYLRVTSAIAQTIVLYIGDDDMAFNQAVTITGTALVATLPSAAISAPTEVALAANTTDVATIPANLARRRITVGVKATGGASIRVSADGATLKGIEIQPGTFAEFDTTAALGVRNDNAVGTVYYTFEET